MPIFPSFFDFLGPFNTYNNNKNNNTVEMDWKETQNSHIFIIDVPGFTKDQIKLHLQDNRVLEITGVKNEEEEEFEKGDIWHCKERIIRGRFSRRFQLPENVKKNLSDDDDDKIKAALENGVLTIIVPKDDDEKKISNQGANRRLNKIRAVEISGADDDDDDDDGRTSSKGLSRFVCCKA